MSKRYGRNQKRKHRELIDNLLKVNRRAAADYQMLKEVYEQTLAVANRLTKGKNPWVAHQQ
jgi:hypothetical protein